jgi:HK97 family phage prohead protease
LLTTTQFSNDFEIRVTGERVLTGIAVPFDTPTDIGGMSESVSPGAFTHSLSGDVRAFVDHDATKLLARVGNGSLVLNERAEGLEYRMRLPDTTLGRDTYQMASEGLLSGVSIGFSMRGSKRVNDGVNGYLLTDVDLREISVITGGNPAYSGTSVTARHRDELWYWTTWIRHKQMLS